MSVLTYEAKIKAGFRQQASKYSRGNLIDITADYSYLVALISLSLSTYYGRDIALNELHIMVEQLAFEARRLKQNHANLRGERV